MYDLLDSLGIDYKRVDHEPAMTMEACEAVDEALETLMCKNLFLCNRQKTAFYLLLMPGDKKFKTKELSSQIGRPEFIVVYGRRRVGKTFLIKEYFNERFSFYAIGINSQNARGQLKAFNISLREYGCSVQYQKIGLKHS